MRGKRSQNKIGGTETARAARLEGVEAERQRTVIAGHAATVGLLIELHNAGVSPKIYWDSDIKKIMSTTAQDNISKENLKTVFNMFSEEWPNEKEKEIDQPMLDKLWELMGALLTIMTDDPDLLRDYMNYAELQWLISILESFSEKPQEYGHHLTVGDKVVNMSSKESGEVSGFLASLPKKFHDMRGKTESEHELLKDYITNNSEKQMGSLKGDTFRVVWKNDAKYGTKGYNALEISKFSDLRLISSMEKIWGMSLANKLTNAVKNKRLKVEADRKVREEEQRAKRTASAGPMQGSEPKSDDDSSWFTSWFPKDLGDLS